MTTTTDAPPQPTPTRIPWRNVGRWARWVVLGGFAAWAGFRALGLDRFGVFDLFIAPLSFTPYVALASVIPVIAAVVVRQRREIAIAVVVLLTFAVCVVPRAIPGGNGGVTGPSVRVLSMNMWAGTAAAKGVMDLVRSEKPDVLSLQELTPEGVAELRALGIDKLLPYSALRPLPAASGTGIYARYPMRNERNISTETTFLMVAAVVRVPGVDVEVVAVHPSPPVPGAPTARWRRDLAQLPEPSDNLLRIMAGDFNATFDHEPFRVLLAKGYRDAADTVGAGLSMTWPETNGIPPVAIDHVLVDGRVDVNAFRTFVVSGGDHRAIFAEVVLPR